MNAATYREVIEALASARPRMTAATLVDLAAAVVKDSPPDLNDAEALGRWAMRQSIVADYVKADKKINAIKELRGLTNASLVQAKSAIEAIR